MTHTLPVVKSMWRPCRANPFYTVVPRMTAYEIIKYIFTAIILLPIRVILVFVLHMIGYFFAIVGTIGLNAKQMAEPMSKWRRRIIGVDKFLTRVALFVMGFYWIKRTQLKASSMPDPSLWRDDDTAAIIVGNHSMYTEFRGYYYEIVSFIDVYYFIQLALPGQVAKSSIAKIPMYGRISQSFQCIFVDRNDRNSRQTVMDEIRRRAQMPRGSFNPVVIFPEGTTTSGEQIIEFKRGAFAPGVPVLPICFKYPNKRHTLAWNQQKAAGVLMRMCLQIANYLEVIHLPVAVPSEAEKKDPDLFAKRVRDAMAAALGVPTSEHSYDDFGVRWPFRKHHIPQMFEFSELKHHFPTVDHKLFVKATVQRYVGFDLQTEHKLLTKTSFAVNLPYSIAHLKRLISVEPPEERPANTVLRNYEDIKSNDGFRMHNHLGSAHGATSPTITKNVSMDQLNFETDSVNATPVPMPSSARSPSPMNVHDDAAGAGSAHPPIIVGDRRKRTRTLKPVVPIPAEIALIQEEEAALERQGAAPSSTFATLFSSYVSHYRRLTVVEFLSDTWVSRMFDIINVEYQHRQKTPSNSVGVIQKDQLRFRSFLLGLMSLYHWASNMTLIEASNLVPLLIDFDGDGLVHRNDILRIIGSPSCESYLRENITNTSKVAPSPSPSMAPSSVHASPLVDVETKTKQADQTNAVAADQTNAVAADQTNAVAADQTNGISPPQISIVCVDMTPEPNAVKVARNLLTIEFPAKYDVISATLQHYKGESEYFIDMVMKFIVCDIIQLKLDAPDVVVPMK